MCFNQIRTSLGRGQYSHWLHITPLSNLGKSIYLPAYTTLSHKVSPQPMHPPTMTKWVMFFLGLRQALWEEPLTMGKPNFNTLIVTIRLNLLSSEKVNIALWSPEGDTLCVRVMLLHYVYVFMEKADTPVMVKHDINLLRNVTIPVLIFNKFYCLNKLHIYD